MGPHVMQLPDGRRVMNPAGTLGNAVAAAGGGGSSDRMAGLDRMGPAPAVPMDFAGMARRGELSGLEQQALGLAPLPAAPGAGAATGQGAGMPVAPGDVPRMFVDSDGIARAGYNMGGEGGLVPADAGGVPIGMQMVPVQGLSQGSMSIGVANDPNRNYSPRIALGADPYAPVTPEQYGGAVDRARSVLGPRGPQMDAQGRTATQAGIQADRDLTRANRYSMEGGPTSAMNRRSQQLRSQGAAMDALTRQTNEQIRAAQGTPQAVAAGNVVSSYTPRADGRGPGEWRESVQPAGQGGSALRHPSGITQDQARRLRMRALPKQKGQIPDWVRMQIATQTPEQQALTLALWDRDDPGDPETVAAMEPILQWFDQQGQAAGGTAVGGGTGGGGQGTGKINKWQE